MSDLKKILESHGNPQLRKFITSANKKIRSKISEEIKEERGKFSAAIKAQRLTKKLNRVIAVPKGADRVKIINLMLKHGQHFGDLVEGKKASKKDKPSPKIVVKPAPPIVVKPAPPVVVKPSPPVVAKPAPIIVVKPGENFKQYVDDLIKKLNPKKSIAEMFKDKKQREQVKSFLESFVLVMAAEDGLGNPNLNFKRGSKQYQFADWDDMPEEQGSGQNMSKEQNREGILKEMKKEGGKNLDMVVKDDTKFEKNKNPNFKLIPIFPKVAAKVAPPVVVKPAPPVVAKPEPIIVVWTPPAGKKSKDKSVKEIADLMAQKGIKWNEAATIYTRKEKKKKEDKKQAEKLAKPKNDPLVAIGQVKKKASEWDKKELLDYKPAQYKKYYGEDAFYLKIQKDIENAQINGDKEMTKMWKTLEIYLAKKPEGWFLATSKMTEENLKARKKDYKIQYDKYAKLYKDILTKYDFSPSEWRKRFANTFSSQYITLQRNNRFLAKNPKVEVKPGQQSEIGKKLQEEVMKSNPQLSNLKKSK
tara:strand:- start:270 stop:1859 length:1590 start_codon:yes stop_codon:yes gene_type:complete